MAQMMRLVIRGAIAGVGVTMALAIWDGVSQRGYMFGLLTAIIGLIAGGISLGLALLMAIISYQMAKADRHPVWRRRLLVGAIFTGAAGMACGISAAALWLAAGRPWFP